MKYTFILSKNIYEIGLYDDLRELENVNLYVSERKYYNKFWNYMHKHNLVRNFMYKMAYKFDEKSLKNNNDNCIVLDSGVLKAYPLDYILYLKKKYNSKLVLILLNSMNASSGNVKDVMSEILSDSWDTVLTFDKEDAEKYGWQYFGLNYFSTPKNVENVDKTESDIYFVGGLKGNRNDLIYDSFKRLNDNCDKVIFDIYCYNNEQLKEVKYADKIRYYTNWKTYKEIKEEVQKANCILEILQENQHTQSVRYFESIYYNKKLLTNNPDIVNLPYYDERYMKYFSKSEDIDTEWVKKKEHINYNYAGEFSPLKIIEMIEEKIGKTYEY